MSLTNKKYKDYSYMSRYNNFPYYWDTIDKKYVYGTTSWLNDETIYSIHTVQEGDTIDSLALYYYGNPTLFWIICDFNRITDPYIDLVVGSGIKIPSISTLRFLQNE